VRGGDGGGGGRKLLRIGRGLAPFLGNLGIVSLFGGGGGGGDGKLDSCRWVLL